MGDIFAVKLVTPDFKPNESDKIVMVKNVRHNGDIYVRAFDLIKIIDVVHRSGSEVDSRKLIEWLQDKMT